MFESTLDSVSEDCSQRASKYRKIVKDKANIFNELAVQSEACASSLSDFENQSPSTRGSIMTAQIAIFDEIQKQKILCEKVSAKYIAWEKNRILPEKEKEKILADVVSKLYTVRQPDILVESFAFEKEQGIPMIFVADGEVFIAHQKSIEKYCLKSGIFLSKRTVEHEIWNIHVEGNDLYYATGSSIMKLEWENETKRVFSKKYSIKIFISEEGEFFTIKQIGRTNHCDNQNNGILNQLNAELQEVCELKYRSKWTPDIALSNKFVALICYNADKTAVSLDILKRNLSAVVSIKLEPNVDSDSVRGIVFLKATVLLLVTCANLEFKRTKFSTKFTVFKIGNRSHEVVFQGVLQLGSLVSDVGYSSETAQVILCSDDQLIRKIHLEAFFWRNTTFQLDIFKKLMDTTTLGFLFYSFYTCDPIAHEEIGF